MRMIPTQGELFINTQEALTKKERTRTASGIKSGPTESYFSQPQRISEETRWQRLGEECSALQFFWWRLYPKVRETADVIRRCSRCHYTAHRGQPHLCACVRSCRAVVSLKHFRTVSTHRCSTIKITLNFFLVSSSFLFTLSFMSALGL